MSKDISIIIVNWNTGKLTLECIRSLTQTKTKLSYEIIVVDNGSKDSSLRILTDLKKKNKGLILIENENNIGFARACNQGIRRAAGKYILLLNSDTRLFKGSMEKLVRFAENNRNVGIVAPRLINPDGSIQGSVFMFPTLFRTLKGYWFGIDKYKSKYFPNRTTTVEAVSMAAVLLTRRAIEEAGLLDERYFFYFEDINYCKRLRDVGLKVYYLSDCLVEHLHGQSGEKLLTDENQWRRMIPSSKIYHGVFNHYLINFIIWSSQKLGFFFLLSLLTILPTITPLFNKGYFYMQDDLQAFRMQQVHKCIQDLQVPCRWVPDAGYGYGYPQFLFYAPFVYYAGEIIHLLGFQFIDTVKIMFILGYVLSAVFIFLLVNELFGKFPALVSTVLYSYSPYKALEVYVRGALSEFWSFVFFPLLFWTSLKLIKTNKRKFLLLNSVILSMFLITHNLMPVIFLPILFIWMFFWIFIDSPVKAKFRSIKYVLTSSILGLGISSFFILPLIFERRFVHIESLLSGYFDYRQHFVSLKNLFLDFRWGWGSSGFPDEVINLSVGLPHIILAIFAFILSLLYIRKNKIIANLGVILFLLETGVLFLIHRRSSFIWEIIPILKWLQFPWRLLSSSVYILALLSAISIYFAGKYKYFLGIVSILSVIITYIGFFTPKQWYDISDEDKFSGESWDKQQTISIFDYTPIYATLPPPSRAPQYPEVLEGNLVFEYYDKKSRSQEGVYLASEKSVIRLPIFDFPGMVVRIDDRKQSHINNDCRSEPYCMGLVTVNVPEGKHKISVILEKTHIRLLGDHISLLTIGIVGYLALKLLLNDRKIKKL